jgi:hypothetical protein
MIMQRFWLFICILVAFATASCEKDLSYVLDDEMAISTNNNFSQPIRDGITKPTQSQTSTCTPSADAANLYTLDINVIAKQLMGNQSPEVVIPETYQQEALRLLTAVYNATDLTARDSVVSQFAIHDCTATAQYEFFMGADASKPWVQNLKNNISPTGNSTIDNLINQHNVSFSYTSFLMAFTGTANSNICMNNLLQTLNGIDGISYTESNPVMGDGNRITVQPNYGYTDITYSYGFGDCQAGCIGRWNWTFRVYPDCTVEHLGSSGTPIN